MSEMSAIDPATGSFSLNASDDADEAAMISALNRRRGRSGGARPRPPVRCGVPSSRGRTLRRSAVRETAAHEDEPRLELAPDRGRDQRAGRERPAGARAHELERRRLARAQVGGLEAERAPA